MVFRFLALVVSTSAGCNRLPGKTRLRNDLLCVEWDVIPCTPTFKFRKSRPCMTSQDIGVHGMKNSRFFANRWRFLGNGTKSVM